MGQGGGWTLKVPFELASVIRIRAFSVHVFTACGAGCALLALVAAARSDWVAVFAWLGLALIIDGVDGSLARHFKIAETLPRWSGDTLDFVIDFTTYVFVPAFVIAASDLLPQVTTVPLAIAIVVSSAVYFADRQMKTLDNYFRGFPVLWNAVVFHLFVLKLSPWLAAGIVVILIILTFVPARFIHPFRVRRWRNLNIAVLTLWSILSIYALVSGLDPERWVAWLLTALALYILGVGLLPRRT